MGMDDGRLDIDVQAVVADPAGNINVPATTLSIVYDSTSPVPFIWSDVVSPTRHNVIMEGWCNARYSRVGRAGSLSSCCVTFCVPAVEFSEFVLGFDLGDILLESGYPTNLVERTPGRRYTFEVGNATDGLTNWLVATPPRRVCCAHCSAS